MLTAGLLTLVGAHTEIYAAVLPLWMLLAFTLGPVKGVGWAQGLFTVLVALVFAQLAPPTWRLAEVRLLDVLVGASVGLLCSQVLFTSDPIKDMGRTASTFLKQLANGLDLTLNACEQAKPAAAETAMGQLSLAQESLAALRAAVGQAHSSRRWSLRGRLNADRLAFVARRYDRHAVRLYATCLLLAESLNRGIAHIQAAPPAGLISYCRWLVASCINLAEQDTVVALKADDPLAIMPAHGPEAADTASLAPEWALARDNARQLENALRALIGSRDA